MVPHYCGPFQHSEPQQTRREVGYPYSLLKTRHGISCLRHEGSSKHALMYPYSRLREMQQPVTYGMRTQDLTTPILTYYSYPRNKSLLSRNSTLIHIIIIVVSSVFNAIYITSWHSIFPSAAEGKTVACSDNQYYHRGPSVIWLSNDSNRGCILYRALEYCKCCHSSQHRAESLAFHGR